MGEGHRHDHVLYRGHLMFKAWRGSAYVVLRQGSGHGSQDRGNVYLGLGEPVFRQGSGHGSQDRGNVHLGLGEAVFRQDSGNVTWDSDSWSLGRTAARATWHLDPHGCCLPGGHCSVAIITICVCRSEEA